MTIAEITKAAGEILALLSEYRHDPVQRRELRIDPVVYGYFQGRFDHMQRQHYVRMHSRPRPQRIDFRFGTSNPVVIELAVRPPNGASELYGPSNKSELRKLTRVIPSQARSRVLLLLDMRHDAIPRENLKASYEGVNSGRGRFCRHTIRVIYVHGKCAYNFIWRP